MHGARINARTSDGTTAINILFRSIVRLGNSNSDMRKKFERLIGEHGANVNVPLPEGGRMRSMLGMALDGNPQVQNLAKYLLKHGARLCEREPTRLLFRWIRDPKFRWFDMSPYAADITKGAALRAYVEVLFRQEDIALTKKLLQWLPWPKAADARLGTVLFEECPSNNVRNMITKSYEVDMPGHTADQTKHPVVPFDATGQDLLHYMVQYIVRGAKYTEAQALKEARVFIKRGATTYKDPAARRDFPTSVVDWLGQYSARKGGAFSKLLLLFYETREIERGGRENIPDSLL